MIDRNPDFEVVGQCGDGLQVVAQVMEAKPDVLVLDCMMEQFSTGFSLAKDVAIKFPDLPMIMLTGVREHMASTWEFGPGEQGWLPVHRFLEKPVDPAALEQEILKLI